MRGEARKKFFVLLLAVIIVITPFESMTFAAGETTEDGKPSATSDEQYELQDDSNETLLADGEQSDEVMRETKPEEDEETKKTEDKTEKEETPSAVQEISEIIEPIVQATDGEPDEEEFDYEENEDALTEDYLRTEEIPELSVEQETVMLYAARKSSISDGDTISYTVKRIGENNHKPYFQSDDYEGMCIEPGKEANDNGGKAKARALSKSDIRVKTAYYMSVVLNYWPTGKGNDNTSDVDTRNARINRAERAVQYASNPKKTMDRMRELNYSHETIDRIVGYVEKAKAITVPESFEAFACDPSTDNQGFILYKYHSGTATLKKQTEGTAYNFPENSSLEGAVYYAYTDAACKVQAYDRKLNPVIFHTDANGNTETYEVATGTYYVKEITPPSGYGLDTEVHSAVVPEDGAVTFQSAEPRDDGHVQLFKKPKETDINFLSAAPNNYALANAEYYLYTDENCTKRAKDTNGKDIVLTTKADGMTNSVKTEPGTYYAKEIKASKGYMLDTTVYSVNVTAANTESNPARVTCNEPQTWGELFKLRKTDKSGKSGWKYLLGTKYRLSYYDADPSSTDVSDKTAKRSWTFETTNKTDEHTGDTYAGIDFASDEPLSGDSFYIENGKRILPCGIFTIEEVEAPAGIARDRTIYYGKIYQTSNGTKAVRVFNTNNDEDMSFEIGSSDSVINKDKPQSVTIIINKKSVLTGASAPDGAERKNVKGSLAGAEYDVYYDNPRKTKPEKIGTIVTDEKGHGEISEYEGEELDLGRYYVEEVKASPGYAIDRLYFKQKKER